MTPRSLRAYLNDAATPRPDVRPGASQITGRLARPEAPGIVHPTPDDTQRTRIRRLLAAIGHDGLDELRRADNFAEALAALAWRGGVR